jgi:hypothetical protein
MTDAQAAGGGDGPAGIEGLGEPLSVHPPARWLRYVDQLKDPERVMPWVLAVVFVGLAVYFFRLYQGGGFRRDDPVIALPIGAAVCLALGIGLGAYAWRTRHKPPKVVIDRPSYSVYEDALVTEFGGATEVLRWADVKDLLSPAASGGKFRLVASDGRMFDINRQVEDEGTLIRSMIDRVTDAQLPAALRALSAGQTVTFGNLGIRSDGLCYKSKQIDWSDVSSMVLHVGPGRSRLQVRQGGATFAWCSVDINGLANNDLLYRLLTRTAPPHLLKEQPRG